MLLYIFCLLKKLQGALKSEKSTIFRNLPQRYYFTKKNYLLCKLTLQSSRPVNMMKEKNFKKLLLHYFSIFSARCVDGFKLLKEPFDVFICTLCSKYFFFVQPTLLSILLAAISCHLGMKITFLGPS